MQHLEVSSAVRHIYIYMTLNIVRVAEVFFCSFGVEFFFFGGGVCVGGG
jgi:hypothetical protein